MAGRVVYFSRAELNENLGGDCRRLVQVFGVLKKSFPGLELITVKETGLKPFPLNSATNVFKDLILDGSYRFWAEQYRRHVLSLMLRSWIWAASVKRSGMIDLAFVEDPVYFPALVESLKKQGTRVIAVCQNIESLSAGQAAPGRQRALLNREIDVLSECALAVTISREEDFLLNNLGINSIFFPYYPVESIAKKMLEIRVEREKREKSGLLLIGSFNNIPTKEGMLKVISFWKKIGYALTGERLMVAGFGTDSLKADEHEGIEVLGTVEEGALGGLCAGIKACLCYQEKASGALTKIPEMLMAGVPVIANTRAARSYYNTEGLFEMTSLEEIGSVLKEAEGFNPPVPKKPSEDALLSSIRKVHGNERQSMAF